MSGVKGATARLRARVLALALALVAFGAGCGSDTPASDEADRFDANRAYELVEQQVAVGPRPAGSPQLRELSRELQPLLPNGSFEAIPGEPGLRNVVGTLPGRKPGIVLGAHYDTLVKPRGSVGANNGAAGTAVVIEAARALRKLPVDPGAREVRFVLFDGEQPPDGLPEESPNFYSEGLRGSRAYADAHSGRTHAMVLVDYVGNQDLRLPREASSTESLWTRLLIAAEAVGAQRFFSNETGASITDDHTPFLRKGIPAIDLIDWSYPGHTLADQLDQISRLSLDGVGETVVQLIEELRYE
jgi:glutaminyl-peptide cyclotransferase